MRTEWVLGAATIIVVIIALAVHFQSSSRSAENSETLTSESGTKISDVKVAPQEGGAPAMEIDENASYSAILKTSMGDITLALTAQETPATVNNFVVLAEKGFYDGTIFHRVIKDFMIQGGDPDGNGTGGPGYTFQDEITAATFDSPGILAMANRGPDTNGSQFFITHAATPWLDGKHTIFGKVTEGMDVVDAIANVKVGSQDKPVEDVVVESVEIVKK
jgi:peptidyl-prolyl cis-trans isomerase A (cyclophilin A)